MTAPDHGTQLLAVEVNSDKRCWQEAAKHNLRVITGPHIDSSRSSENVVLLGPADVEGIVAVAHEGMLAANIQPKKIRANGTRMAEILCGLPASSAVDHRAYFEAVVDWAAKRYGSEAVLSAIVHNDEANPHVHILMLPMDHGVWKASRLFGGPGDLARLQDEFHSRVASRFGVRRAPKKMSAKERKENAKLVVAELERTNAPELRGQLWPAVRAEIQRNPGRYLELLGLEAKRDLKTMAEVFTGKGAGPAREKTAIAVWPLQSPNSYPVLAVCGRAPVLDIAHGQRDQPIEVAP